MMTIEILMTNHSTRAIKMLAAVFLLALPVAQAQDVILDNSGTQFTTFGTWPASTAVSGYQGSNYQVHEANGTPPGAVLVDNTSAGFSVTGTWPTSTAVSGYLGTNYQVHSANGEEPGAIILDNLQGQASGTWAGSTSVSGYYGSNYQTHVAGSGSSSFNWNTPLASGNYQVYARWTVHPNRATNARYTIADSTGTHTVMVNQQVNGSSWQLLGSYAFDTAASITLTDQANGYVIADAIKIVPQDAAPNTATWTPGISEAGDYNVYARWTAHPNRATNAGYTVTHASGTTVVTVNQQQSTGQWQMLGSFNLDANSKVSLTDQANGYVIADAIQFIPTNQSQANIATWTPNVNGIHEVYAKWTQYPNRATNASYTVTHASGTTVITVNQQANGGNWQLLGSFNLNTASRIQLTDQANGYVIADAIKLVATNVAPIVGLTSPSANAVSTAPGAFILTADASDGDGMITKVEFYNGSNLLSTVTTAPYAYVWDNVAAGSYSLTAVATDNQGAITTSAAVVVTSNALPAISLTSPLDNAATINPGNFTLTADASSTTSSIVKVDFYANGTLIGTATSAPYTYNWNNVAIGTYSLTAAATDSFNGTTTSAVVSVQVNSAIAQAYYIHPDQLGTPRMVTASNGTVVWQWDNVDPFGANIPNENPSGAGQFNFNLRFPGQYADRETNTHYNINRDYDPATGRYIQSDPIGLQGGINTYGYVGGNPLSYTDPDGRNIFVAGGVVLTGLAIWKGIEFLADMGQMIIRAEMGADSQRAADAMSVICQSSRNSGACNAEQNFQKQVYQCTVDTAKLGTAAAWNANKPYPSNPIMPGWKLIP